MSSKRQKRTYDHRLRELVRSSGDVTIAIKVGVPRSTAAGWLRRPGPSVVTAPDLAVDDLGLREELVRLRSRVRRLTVLQGFNPGQISRLRISALPSAAIRTMLREGTSSQPSS